MDEREKLQIELDLLLSLEHTPAWTGTLGSLKQSSYVIYSDITKLINDKRLKLVKTKKYDNRD